MGFERDRECCEDEGVRVLEHERCGEGRGCERGLPRFRGLMPNRVNEYARDVEGGKEIRTLRSEFEKDYERPCDRRQVGCKKRQRGYNYMQFWGDVTFGITHNTANEQHDVHCVVYVEKGFMSTIERQCCSGGVRLTFEPILSSKLKTFLCHYLF